MAFGSFLERGKELLSAGVQKVRSNVGKLFVAGLVASIPSSTALEQNVAHDVVTQFAQPITSRVEEAAPAAKAAPVAPGIHIVVDGELKTARGEIAHKKGVGVYLNAAGQHVPMGELLKDFKDGRVVAVNNKTGATFVVANDRKTVRPNEEIFFGASKESVDAYRTAIAAAESSTHVAKAAPAVQPDITKVTTAATPPVRVAGRTDIASDAPSWLDDAMMMVARGHAAVDSPAAAATLPLATRSTPTEAPAESRAPTAPMGMPPAQPQPAVCRVDPAARTEKIIAQSTNPTGDALLRRGIDGKKAVSVIENIESSGMYETSIHEALTRDLSPNAATMHVAKYVIGDEGRAAGPLQFHEGRFRDDVTTLKDAHPEMYEPVTIRTTSAEAITHAMQRAFVEARTKKLSIDEAVTFITTRLATVDSRFDLTLIRAVKENSLADAMASVPKKLGAVGAIKVALVGHNHPAAAANITTPRQLDQTMKSHPYAQKVAAELAQTDIHAKTKPATTLAETMNHPVSAEHLEQMRITNVQLEMAQRTLAFAEKMGHIHRVVEYRGHVATLTARLAQMQRLTPSRSETAARAPSRVAVRREDDPIAQASNGRVAMTRTSEQNNAPNDNLDLIDLARQLAEMEKRGATSAEKSTLVQMMRTLTDAHDRQQSRAAVASLTAGLTDLANAA